LAGDKIAGSPKVDGELKLAAARIVESRTTARAACALDRLAYVSLLRIPFTSPDCIIKVKSTHKKLFF
jgi:hypothetical protein